MSVSFKGAARKLDDAGLAALAREHSVGVAELRAFMDVETGGSGFDKAGRPKMLFEPHVFYRMLDPARRAAAVKAGLAYPKWGTKPYPRDSYPRLEAAMAIDETAALQSASWGLGQIMGGNHKAAGFDTPQAMVLAFAEDEASQVRAMISFLETNGLMDDLRNHRWQALARGYNGPGYAKNAYDKKLAAAYARRKVAPATGAS